MDIHRCRFIDYSPHSITSLKFSATSSAQNASYDLRLAVGRSNGDIEIWNPRYSWFHEMTMKGGKGRAIEGLTWSTSEDGDPRLFSIGGSSFITEWDLKTGQPLVNYDCHAATIWSIAVSPDGTKLAAGCDNGAVVIVDIAGGPGVIEYEKRLQRQTERVLSIAWRGKTQVVGGCADARIRIWSTKDEDNGRVIATMRVDKARGENTLVWSVLVLKNKLIVSGDSTGSVKFWDGNNFSLLQTFQVHEADVLCLTSDVKGDSVFSAGVDRKVVNYRVVDSKLRRWANVSSRLLHSHDVRAMASFEAKGANFLVSGGVESTLVVNSVKDFMDGMFRKIPITKHKPCVSVTPKSRYITMWEDQTVKIWRVDKQAQIDEDGKGRKLVLKMVLNNEENITHVSLSEDGSVIGIATLAEIKLFKLIPKDDSLQVEKIESQLSELGATLLQFIGNDRLAIITPESDAIVYTLGSEEAVELDGNDNVASKDKTKLAYTSNITHITVSQDNSFLATARYSGVIDIFDLKSDGKYVGSLARTSAPPCAIKFTASNTLVVVTAENRVFEFDVERRALTAWSKRNSDLLPRELLSLVDKCCGVFYDVAAPERIWLWGANWLAFIDLGVNISVERAPKRKLDRLGLLALEGEEVDQEDRRVDYENGTASPASTSSNSSSTRPFWITYKYRPILVADSLGENEFAVVERPPFSIPLPPAFWSTHKISM